MKILIIEDESDLVYFLKKILENAGNIVSAFGSYDEFLESKVGLNHDLLLLDLLLPGKNGEQIVKEIRKAKSHMPVLILSAIDKVPTKTQMLNMGVDDYVTKPFDVQELMARINAVYRRSIGNRYTEELSCANLIFYPKQNLAMRDKKKISLTQKEGELLHFLFQNIGHVVRTQDILRNIWNANSSFYSNVVQATVRRLRKKIDEGSSDKLIHNIHGIGYMLAYDHEAPKN